MIKQDNLNTRYQKFKKLKSILKNLGSVVVAYSGGVDSSFLLKVAKDVLGKENVLAVTAYSEIYPKNDYKYAKALADKLGVNHFIIHTEELKNSNFRRNSPARCFYCKFGLFKKLNSLCREKGYNRVVDGTNYEDRFDYRPGAKARKIWNVLSPLEKAGLKKNEIRLLAKGLDLSNWNKPAQACLASRFSYGTEITPEKLKMVESAEDFLRKKGFQQIRVRLHQDITRIEVGKDEISKFFYGGILMFKIIRKFKNLGFKYITLDLEGYRKGSLNP